VSILQPLLSAQIIFMGFIRFSENKGAISLNSIKKPVILMDTRIFYEGGKECLENI
jgi:hypothetical protein